MDKKKDNIPAAAVVAAALVPVGVFTWIIVRWGIPSLSDTGGVITVVCCAAGILASVLRIAATVRRARGGRSGGA